MAERRARRQRPVVWTPLRGLPLLLAGAAALAQPTTPGGAPQPGPSGTAPQPGPSGTASQPAPTGVAADPAAAAAPVPNGATAPTALPPEPVASPAARLNHTPPLPPVGPETTAPWAALEALGTRIGRIHIIARDIFDDTDPSENNLLFRLANTLHVRTQPAVVERALLFRSGEPVRARLIDETERVLRAMRQFYSVQIRPLPAHDGVVDIEVITRDTWSLDIGVTAGRQGGASTGSLRLKDYNLLGTGMTVAISRNRDVDRTSTELQFAQDRVAGSPWGLAASLARSDDGERQSVSLDQPFYSLETRQAATFSLLNDRRVDVIQDGGVQLGRYQRRHREALVSRGRSTGLVGGAVRRTTLGWRYEEDTFDAVGGQGLPPGGVPPDSRISAPFIRLQWLEDRYQQLRNRDTVARPEYFALGWSGSVDVGWSLPLLGSARSEGVFSMSVARGLEPAPRHTLLLSGTLDGRVTAGLVRRQLWHLQAQYYRPLAEDRVLYGAAALDVLVRPGVDQLLQIGGDNGLRGYPLRYQSGTRRALLTGEYRAYTDWYLLRLFRIGAAAFVDVGHAWSGAIADSQTGANGWLADTGLGLRLVNDRSAFGNVTHIDLATPLQRGPNVKGFQLIVKTRVKF